MLSVIDSSLYISRQYHLVRTFIANRMVGVGRPPGHLLLAVARRSLCLTAHYTWPLWVGCYGTSDSCTKPTEYCWTSFCLMKVLKLQTSYNVNDQEQLTKGHALPESNTYSWD